MDLEKRIQNILRIYGNNNGFEIEPGEILIHDDALTIHVRPFPGPVLVRTGGFPDGQEFNWDRFDSVMKNWISERLRTAIHVIAWRMPRNIRS